MTPVKLEWRGLANTLAEDLVGFGSAFDCSNVSLERGILEASEGYTVQIPETGQTAWGFGYGSYLGTEEFLAVLGSKAYKAALEASTWTLVASGIEQSNWMFQSYASRLYGVSDTGGLIYHTLGGTDWSGAGRPPTPNATGFIFTFERFYNQGLESNVNSIQTYTSISSAWAASGFVDPQPTFSSSSAYSTTFTFNKTTTSNQFGTVHLNLPHVDWSFQDRLRVNVKLNLSGGVFRLNNLQVYLATASTGQLIPIGGTVKQIQMTQHEREFYFYGSRTARADTTRLSVSFEVLRAGAPNTAVRQGDTFTVSIYLGDVWQNDTTIAINTGPTQGSRTYGYSVYDESASVESNLSPVAVSASTPTNSLGSYTRVSLTPVTGGALTSSDTLRLYRKRLSDGKFVRIGTVANTGEPWFPPDRNPDAAGTCYVDDHYCEFDLTGLPEFEQSANLPVSYTPQAIGSYNSSLVLGVGPDMAVSKVDLPLEYELPGDPAPKIDDYQAGRYVFVDPSRSEKVNMIVDGEVLYLGTRKRTYMTVGSFPKDLIPPVTVDNNGPIGPRAFSVWGNKGVIILNAVGLWHLQPNQLSGSNQSAINSEPITDNLRGSITTLSPSSSSVVAVHRGDIYVFQGSKFLKRSRATGFWTQGTLNHQIKAAVPDSYNDMRLLTNNGGLLKWTGSTFAGSGISWFYETGKEQTERRILRKVTYVTEGTPTLTITAGDGINGTVSPTYTLTDDYKNIQGFEAIIGTDWTLRFEGSTNDKVHDVVLWFDYMGGGGDL